MQQSQAYFDENVGIKAPDARTLIVHLENPCSYFLELAGFITFVPMHRPSIASQMVLDQRSGLWTLDPLWTRPDRVIGNGPYVLERRRFKRDILLTANPQYWNPSAMGNQSILMQIVGDPGAAMLAYRRGEVDWLPDIPTASPLAADLMRQQREGLRKDVHLTAGAGTYFYNFNCAPTFLDGSKNPLHDARVRQALSLAIDRQTLVERVTRGFQPIARTFVPPGALPGYEPPVDALLATTDLADNLKRARKLLDEAGYPNGRGLTGLSILYNTEGAHAAIAQQVKNHWEQALGVSVNLMGVEKSQFGQRLRSHDFAISRAAWFGDYRDATTFLDKFLSDNGNNDARYHNPRFDELMQQAARELDTNKRLRILEQAERLMLSEQPIAPIYHYTIMSVHDPEKVSGITLNAWNYRRLEWVKVNR
ncbi:MAG: peptide ABC transporter substrate-binding protein [Phycisphaerales bacterium]|nr:peptide ABC transporter substrate-binding protein [Phycisphaerales bacterium]